MSERSQMLFERMAQLFDEFGIDDAVVILHDPDSPPEIDITLFARGSTAWCLGASEMAHAELKRDSGAGWQCVREQGDDFDFEVEDN